MVSFFGLLINSKKMLIMWIIAIMIVVGLVVYKYYYLQKNIDINISFVEQIECQDQYFNGGAWAIVRSEKELNQFISSYKPILSPVDFESEMFIVSLGKKIDRLHYKKASINYTSRRKFVAIPDMDEELNSNLVFVYKTNNTLDVITPDAAGLPPDFR